MAVTSNPAPAAQTSQDELQALLCEVLPPQGAWSDDAYLWLTDHNNRLIEFTDGHVEELPVATFTHQAVLAFLYDLFRAYVKTRGGVVMFAALRVRIRPGKFREPDLLLLRDRTDARCQDRYWLGADLVAEVVSPDNPDRDLVEKRTDYAEAGIPEYWIADPRDETNPGAHAAGCCIRRAWRLRTREHGDVAAIGRFRRRGERAVRRPGPRSVTGVSPVRRRRAPRGSSTVTA